MDFTIKRFNFNIVVGHIPDFSFLKLNGRGKNKDM